MQPCAHHHVCKASAIKAAKNACAKAGARFTKSRQDVFEVLWEGHQALTASEIMEITGNKQPPMTYRSLEFLKEQGLIHYIASLNAYVGCLHVQNGNHVGQMMVCTSCRTVTEVDANGALPELFKVAEYLKFNVHETHIEMLGLCTNCEGLK